jgi:hypothetical protein
MLLCLPIQSNQKISKMKKLLIVFSAVSLFFAACNNDKAATKEETKSTSNKEDSRDDKSSKDDNSSNDDNSSREDNSSSKGWSVMEVNQFVNSCVGEAEKGMTRATAQKYCECMQVKIEKMYPVAMEAAGIDMNSDEVKQMVMDCLN